MRVVARYFIKAAYSFFPTAIICAAFSWICLQPTVVWSEVVLVKKPTAAPPVYLGSIISDTSPSPTQPNCAITDGACQRQGSTGPVPDALKSSFAKALRHEGVNVVTKKPSQDIFDEVTVSFFISNNLPASPPIVPIEYVCKVMGMIIRHGPEGTIKRQELERHKAATGDSSASSSIMNCLQPAALLVKQNLKTMNQPRRKKDQ